jgi:hypothetical protein
MSLHYVTKKKNQYKERFSLKKLKKSLSRSGASNELIKNVCEEVRALCTDDEVSSTVIHNLALRILKRKSSTIAVNYSLKRGLSELGPSGYPFEVLCGEILKQRGYKTKVGVTLAGAYVTHEVDVLAEKPGRVLM